MDLPTGNLPADTAASGYQQEVPVNDAILPRASRGNRSHERSPIRTALEWAVLLAGALFLVIIVRAFLFQAFYIPTPSMVPTLKVHDRVLVNKLSYRLHDINRGDIVVFEAPEGQGTAEIKDLVKRVVGLPGDVVQSTDGRVTINGKALREPYLPQGTVSDLSAGPLPVPGGCGAPTDGSAGCVVPADTIFVMGDNRSQSRDSRWFGPVKQSSVVGRVFLRVWPFNRVGTL